MAQRVNSYSEVPPDEFVAIACRKLNMEIKMATVFQMAIPLLSVGLIYGAQKALSSKVLPPRIKLFTATFCIITTLALGILFVGLSLVKKHHISFISHARRVGAEAQENMGTGATVSDAYRYTFEKLQREYEQMPPQDRSALQYLKTILQR